MANSIPYDPTLVLGNILETERITALQEIAEAQKPSDLANDKFNAMVTQNYKIGMIYNQMISMGIPSEKMLELSEKKNEMKTKMSGAAVELAKAIIATEQKTTELKLKFSQTQISKSIESPIDYENCTVNTFNLSFDAIKFDVQYVRNESNKEDTEAGASNETTSVGASLRALATTASTAFTDSVAQTSLSQHSNHKIEGTIVIVASCTHKMAAIIDPFVIDPKKAVKAWNFTYPDDRIDTDPSKISEAAFSTSVAEEMTAPALNLLSGCTKGSSFVGFLHILQKEETTSSQTSSAGSSAFMASVKTDMFVMSASGSYGTSSNFGEQAKSLMSTSELESHVSIVCEGLIPSIVADDVTTTVNSLKPAPGEVMSQLGAITSATDGAVNDSMEAHAGSGKAGAQFMKMDSEYLKNTVSNMGEITNKSNRVLNISSMFKAFTDFVTKAAAGEAGIPINFFIKRLTKADIAKEYMIKYYPNGGSGLGALKGQLEITDQENQGE
mmetsp:Transcript_30061/g.45803  ORF Transcript_30061/g.45803 Transcript_30061/m.45803 type:complete len:499 (-) Transcript_30061:154-1650(-)